MPFWAFWQVCRCRHLSLILKKLINFIEVVSENKPSFLVALPPSSSSSEDSIRVLDGPSSSELDSIAVCVGFSSSSAPPSSSESFLFGLKSSSVDESDATTAADLYWPGRSRISSWTSAKNKLITCIFSKALMNAYFARVSCDVSSPSARRQFPHWTHCH